MSFYIPTAAIGNSLSLATLGKSGELMGFFYPRIDHAQNIREAMPAVRLLHANQFLWCFDHCWEVTQQIEPGTDIAVTAWRHRELDLQLELRDVLPPGQQALLRRVTLHKGPHVEPVQFVHYFKFAAGGSAECNGIQSFVDDNAVVQHHRDIALAVSANRPFAAQCGSYKPHEESHVKQSIHDGQFGTSPQAIGRVDFAIGFEPVHDSDWQSVVVLAGGSTSSSAMMIAKQLAGTRFDDVVATANERTQAILADAGNCPVPDLTDAYERAVISLHDLFDEQEGTFIAAPEFDPGYELSGGYGYCWPRDAAICSLAMQRLNREDLAWRFFEWAQRTQLDDGHWYQRYWADGSFAPSWCVRSGEIQLDQTCAMLQAAGVFARRLNDRRDEFVAMYHLTAQRAADAICAMVGHDFLHTTAIDLWENATGSFAYTQAGVIAALREADEVFGIDQMRTGPEVRSNLQHQLASKFWDETRQRWLRRITPDGEQDATLDSSAMGLIVPWGVLDLHEPHARQLAIATLDGISSDLRSEVKGGEAILRFHGESYMGGGPGCVNTLWLAVCRLCLAETAVDRIEQAEQRQLAMNEISVALANTNPCGQLPELIPKIQFDYWAAPHAWASSLLIEAVLTMRRLDAGPTNPFACERAKVRRRAPSR